MKDLRSLLVLFFATAASLIAQDAPSSPVPVPAPTADTANQSTTVLTPAPVDTTPPSATPSTTTPITAGPLVNPLAPVSSGPIPIAPAPSAPVAPAVVISVPTASDISPATDANGASTNVMHKANFPQTDVRAILSSVATLFNLNVIIPDSLTGTTTIQLHNVTWQQIFRYVLDPLGYTYTVDGTGPNAVIQIKNKTEIASEAMETRVIPINSAQAADLAKSLTNFLDSTSKPPETLIADSRTNYLIVTAHPSKMNNIQDAIEKLDKPTQQVFIEAKFIEVQANDNKDLGIDWNFNGTPLGSIGYAYQYGAFHELGAVYSSGAVPSQLPQLTVAQAAASATPANNLNFATPSTSLNPPAAARTAVDLAFFNQAQYTAVLNALQTITNAKLVSDPTAVTVDNQEITLYSGTTISVVFPSLNNQTGQTSAGEIKTYDVGVTLKVKPHVTNNGFINLVLNPMISRLDPNTDTYYNTQYPRFDTRKLTDANVSIKDGFTLAIGGLIDDQDSKNTSQVPILADIPIIGEFFKSADTIHQRNNLIIFVTARTLSNDGASFRDVVSPDTMLRSGITAEEIPGYYYNKRTADTPGMVYPTKDEVNTMENVQNLRDQAAQLKALQDYQAELKTAQDEQSKLSKSQKGSQSGNSGAAAAPTQIRH